MNHASLFSGIGGFDLAAEWMGWQNTFHCEWNPFGQKVLKHHFPNSICHEDITKTDFNIYRGRIDILSGGFPCQPYSTAGKRLGKEDDRHLWPEMLRAIREIQPRWVVGENVLGLTNWNGGLVFEEVCADLEAEGYEVQPFILPAASVNAAHRRDRVWFIAYAKNDRLEHSKKPRSVSESKGKTRISFGGFTKTESQISITTNSKSESSGGKLQQRQRQGESGGCNSGDVANSSSQGLQGSENKGGTKSSRAKRDKQLTGCLRSNFENFPTQSPICGGDDGLPAKLDGITFPKWRNESIKAYGNAIVPQVVHQIFKAIQEYEDL